MPLHVLSTCAHHQEVKIALHSFGIITHIGGRLVRKTATYRCDDYIIIAPHVPLNLWQQLEYRSDICRATTGAHTEVYGRA
jgi:hypothetical protein